VREIISPESLLLPLGRQGGTQCIGKTVAECLDALVQVIPLINKALSYDAGALDPHIKVLVNKEGVGAEGPARKVDNGDEIHFVLGTA
jgi:hypothetical protein